VGSHMILTCNMQRKYSEISSEAGIHLQIFSMMKMTSMVGSGSNNRKSSKKVVNSSKRAKVAGPELMISSANKMSLPMVYSVVASAEASEVALEAASVEAWGEACMISSAEASATSVVVEVDLLKCRPFPQAWGLLLGLVQSNLKLS